MLRHQGRVYLVPVDGEGVLGSLGPVCVSLADALRHSALAQVLQLLDVIRQSAQPSSHRGSSSGQVMQSAGATSGLGAQSR